MNAQQYNTIQYNTIVKKYAKLLAGENITVKFENNTQPKFNTKTRTLTIPYFDIKCDSDIAINKMFIAHEVGHALFTSSQIVEDQNKRINPIFKYVNILEDVRIERKMKKMFKGLSSQFFDGYKHFTQEFSASTIARVNGESLINRINSFYKFGEFIDVTFSDAELDVVREANETETLYDVINLAEKIANADKQDQKQQQQQEEQLSDESDESEDGDNKDDSNNENQGKKETVEKKKPSKPSKPKSDNGSSDNTDGGVEESILEKIMNQIFEEFISNANQLMQSSVDLESESFKESTLKQVDFDAFISQNKHLTVNNSFLVEKSVLDEVNISTQQFNMFKDARKRLNTRKYKSGDLDVDLLYKHKLSDDVFRTNEIRYREENHGFVFLLDYSGSMENTINDVVYQLFVLCLFAKRNKIPFEVYCFAMLPTKYEQVLVRIFHSDLTEPELKKRYNNIFNYIKSSGSTPLVEACGTMLANLETFKANNKNRKLSYIILSDGGEDGFDLSDILIYKGKEYDINEHKFKYMNFVDIAKDIGYNTIGYFLACNENISTNPNNYLKYLGTSFEDSEVVVKKDNLIKVLPKVGFNSAFVMSNKQTTHDKKVFLQHFISEMS